MYPVLRKLLESVSVEGLAEKFNANNITDDLLLPRRSPILMPLAKAVIGFRESLAHEIADQIDGSLAKKLASSAVNEGIAQTASLLNRVNEML